MGRPIPPSFGPGPAELQRSARAARVPCDPRTGRALRGNVPRGRFDAEMVRVPPPTGKRGRQPADGDAAIRTGLTAARQGIEKQYPERDEGPFRHGPSADVRLRRAPPASGRPGPGRAGLRHHGRRRKTPAVNVPRRGSQDPLHLPIPSRALLRDTLPGGGRHRHRGRGRRRRRMERPRTRRPETPTMAQDPHRHRRADAADPGHPLPTGNCDAITGREIAGSHVGDAPMPPEPLDRIPADEEIGSDRSPPALSHEACVGFTLRVQRQSRAACPSPRPPATAR